MSDHIESIGYISIMRFNVAIHFHNAHPEYSVWHYHSIDDGGRHRRFHRFRLQCAVRTRAADSCWLLCNLTSAQSINQNLFFK